MKFLRKYADNSRSDSIANKWRRKRFTEFLSIIDNIPKPVKILDVGGTENFWQQMGFTDYIGVKITILNKEPLTITNPAIKFVRGDACDLSRFNDKSFDVVFSNSVIEHVGSYDDRKKMADEVIRVGKKYFVQTPNYYFPIEPHFLFPFFQFFPEALRIFLVKNFKLGWFEKCGSDEEAKELINSIKLLKKKELLGLFPGADIIKEKFLFLTKSFTAVHK